MRIARSFLVLNRITRSSPLTLTTMALSSFLYIGLGRSTTKPVRSSTVRIVGAASMPMMPSMGSTPMRCNSATMSAVLIFGCTVDQNALFGWLSAMPYRLMPTRFFSARVIAASRCISTWASMLVTSLELPVARLEAEPVTLMPEPTGWPGVLAASSRNSGT